MNNRQQKRLFGILLIILLIGIALGLVLYALKQNINLFYTPTQVLQNTISPEQIIRVGGYVKQNSVHYSHSGQAVNFTVTDHQHELEIIYQGILPNLFREGQGVVITGKLTNAHTLQADQVLAKHDEKYMPWSLAKELKKEDAHVS